VPAAFWTLLVLLIVAVVVVGAVARDDIVRLYPPSIDLYEGMGLAVDRSVLSDHPDLQPALQLVGLETVETDDGGLVLSGSLINEAAERRRVRPLVVTLVDAEGAEISSRSVDLEQSGLDGGQSVDFEVEIDEWPEGAVSADIRFAN